MSVKTNTISERTADAGVTIDGLLIKDGALPALPGAGITSDQALALAAYQAAVAAAETGEALLKTAGGVEFGAAGGPSLGYTEAIISIEQTGTNNPILGVLKNNTGLSFTALRIPTNPVQYILGTTGGAFNVTRTQVTSNVVANDSGTYAKTLLVGTIQASSIALFPYNVKTATYEDLVISTSGRLPFVTIRIYE